MTLMDRPHLDLRPRNLGNEFRAKFQLQSCTTALESLNIFLARWRRFFSVFACSHTKVKMTKHLYESSTKKGQRNIPNPYIPPTPPPLPEAELTENQEEFAEAPEALGASSLGRPKNIFTLIKIHPQCSSCIIWILMLAAQLLLWCFMYVWTEAHPAMPANPSYLFPSLIAVRH